MLPNDIEKLRQLRFYLKLLFFGLGGIAIICKAINEAVLSTNYSAITLVIAVIDWVIDCKILRIQRAEKVKADAEKRHRKISDKDAEKMTALLKKAHPNMSAKIEILYLSTDQEIVGFVNQIGEIFTESGFNVSYGTLLSNAPPRTGIRIRANWQVDDRYFMEALRIIVDAANQIEGNCIWFEVASPPPKELVVKIIVNGKA